MSDKTQINLARLRALESNKQIKDSISINKSPLTSLAEAATSHLRVLDWYHGSDTNWKTIKHAKVLLNGKGKIVGGAGGKFNGKRFGAKWRKKKNNSSNVNQSAGATNPLKALASSVVSAKKVSAVQSLTKPKNQGNISETKTVGTKTHKMASGKSMVGMEYSGVSKQQDTLQRINSATRQIVKAQGFDGKPRVVSQKEFDDACKATGFIGFRTYSADSKALLDKYQKDLYDGDFYTDCNGGSVYGHGMYVAVAKIDNKTNVEYAKGDSASYGYQKYCAMEAITLDKDSKILRFNGNNGKVVVPLMYSAEYALSKFKTPKNAKKLEQVKKELAKALETGSAIDTSKYETVISEAIGSANYRKIVNRMDFLDNDVGTLAAELGYDAIDNNFGNLGYSYCVVLNRTKCIIKEGGEKSWKI